MQSISETTVSEFWEELEKIAGVRDALRLVATGKVPLRHGTTKATAKKIKELGLRPQGTSGISELVGIPGERGTAFTTRSKAKAGNYAMQSEGLRRAKRLREMLPTSVKDRIRESGLLEGLEEGAAAQGSNISGANLLELQAARALASFPGGRVVNARVPWRELRGIETSGTELHAPTALQLRETLRGVSPQLEKLPAMAFASDVPVQGGLSASRIVGSPHYQRSSLQSLREHLRNVRAEPRAFGKEVARAATGFSHRPSTLLNQSPASLRPRLTGPVAE